MRTVHRAIVRLSPAAVLLLAAALGPLTRGAHAQVSVGGVVYAQYQYNVAGDTLAADSSIQHINNFDITRAYLNVTGRFAGGIYTRVTADIFTSANIAGSRAYRIKYAYVAWTPDSSALTFKLGEMHTPLLDWEEALWDYRMQGQMAMERGSAITGISYVSSSDFGIGVDGKFSADRLNFQAGIFNGENYSGALGDNRKDLMGRVSYRLANTDDGSRVGGLRATAYVQLGSPSSGGQRNRYLGMLSYRTMNLTLAAEYAITKDSVHGGPTAVNNGGVVAASPQRTGRVISLFGVFHVPQSRVSFIGRVDLTDPQTDSTAAAPGVLDKTTRIIAGVSYQLTPNLRLLADLDMLSFESGFTPTAANYATYATRNSAFFQAMFTF
jgi:hypothetical protein